MLFTKLNIGACLEDGRTPTNQSINQSSNRFFFRRCKEDDDIFLPKHKGHTIFYPSLHQLFCWHWNLSLSQNFCLSISVDDVLKLFFEEI